MDDIILNDIKTYLGIMTNDVTFDPDLKVFLNQAVSSVWVVGAPVADGFSVIIGDETWREALPTVNDTQLNLIKQNICLRIKALFDPPNTGFTSSSLNSAIEQNDWRLKAAFIGG